MGKINKKQLVKEIFGKKVLEFSCQNAFKTAFSEEVAKNEKFIVLFEAGINNATGQSWCPDCIFAKDDISRIVNEAIGKRTVLRASVTRSEWPGNKGHSYRHQPFGASSVPSMILFEGSKALHKVEDLNDFRNKAVMRKFLDGI